MVKKKRGESVHEIDGIIEERVKASKTRDMISIYEELLRDIWDGIVPRLGSVTV
jgi:hypothetical protein